MMYAENIKKQYKEALKAEKAVNEIKEDYVAALEFENKYLRKEVERYKIHAFTILNRYKSLCDKLDKGGFLSKFDVFGGK